MKYKVKAVTSFNYRRVEDLQVHLQNELHGFSHVSDPNIACKKWLRLTLLVLIGIALPMDQRSMDRKLRSLTIVYSTNAANGPICAKFCMQISLNIPVTSVKLRAFLVDE